MPIGNDSGYPLGNRLTACRNPFTVTGILRAATMMNPGEPIPIDYLNPQLPAGLKRVVMPVVTATDASLAGYGRLVDDPAQCSVEIVRWPAVGRRPVDPGTGDQAGTTEGVFVSEWKGDVLFGRNEAVDGHYILAYATEPTLAHTRITSEFPPGC